MSKPGRISSAALSIAPLDVDGQPPKLVPSPGLSAAERTAFTDIVGSCSRAHFRPSDGPLLGAYARAIVLERVAGAALELNPLDPKALALWEKASRTMVAIAGKLRLCPQSRQHPRSTARMQPSSGPKPWAG